MTLGKIGIKVLDLPTIKQLELALLFGLGWIGFIFGLHFEVMNWGRCFLR